MDEVVMSVSEAAEFLRVKISTIYQKKAKREIPFHKVGGKIVFFKSELVDWVKSN